MATKCVDVSIGGLVGSCVFCTNLIPLSNGSNPVSDDRRLGSSPRWASSGAPQCREWMGMGVAGIITSDYGSFPHY